MTITFHVTPTTTEKPQPQPQPSLAKRCCSYAVRQISHVVSTVALAPFRIAKLAVVTAAKPVAYVAGICIVAHILLKPKDSLQIAQDGLKAIPGTLQAAFEGAPDALNTMLDVSQRIYQASLQTIGDKVVLPEGKDNPKTPHTLFPVLKGVALATKDAALDALPTIRDGAESLLTLTTSLLQQSYEFATTTIIPGAIDQFNKTCPKTNGDLPKGSPSNNSGVSNVVHHFCYPI